MVILLVVAAGGSFLGAYLKTRATNAAMADDLEAIKQQLRETTDTAETIRAQIGKRGELHTLRIKKLEELMEAFITADTVCRNLFQNLMGETVTSSKIDDNMDHLLMLSKFYFPKFEPYLNDFRDSWRKCLEDTLEQRRAHHEGSGLRLDIWRACPFPLKDEAVTHSAKVESLLIAQMHHLLNQSGPKDAGRVPA
ncbi:hypothetical protein D3C87_1474110 [compost metagenome]